MRQRVLNNGMLDVASLSGLDGLRSDKKISSGAQARDKKCKKDFFKKKTLGVRCMKPHPY